jgi:hypothetical protein
MKGRNESKDLLDIFIIFDENSEWIEFSRGLFIDRPKWGN